MTFPDSERVVYGVHTLANVICQLQFPPVLAIGTGAPSEFQEHVRDAYPLYEREEIAGVPPELANLLAQLPVKPAGPVTHKFTTAAANRTITLASNALGLSDTDYDEWPSFRREMEAAQAAVEAVYRPAFYTRVGLRYQDVIDRKKLGLSQHEWADLFNPTLTGLLGAAESSVREGVLEVIGNALIGLDGVEGAAVRIVHGLARTADNPDVIYLVDADYFVEGQREGGEVLDILDYFNREAGRFFRWAITDTLRDALGRREVAVPTNQH